MEKACVHCGETFQAKCKTHSYCSPECRRAIRGTEWRQARQVALFRDEHRCTICGSEEHLEVHHIQPLSMGGTHATENLTTLCHKHHVEAHRKLRRQQRQREEAHGREREKGVCYAA